MLNQVTIGLRRAARNHTLRHPNSVDVQVYRRKAMRTYEGADSMGGMPTLGGMGVLDADDEPEVDYELLGDGRVHFVGILEPASMSDTRDVANAGMDAPREVAFEPITEGAIEPKDGDLIFVLPGAGIVVTYEVTDVIATVHMPPYVCKLAIQAQGDLAFAPAVAAALAARPSA